MPFIILLAFVVMKGCLSSVHLYGPKYFVSGDTINLTCTSDDPPPGLIADFLINNKSYTSLLKTKDGCFNTVLRLRCNPISCGCSDDGKTFYLQHARPLLKSFNLIVCSMRFQALKIEDRLMVYVVDLHGPTLTMDHVLPLKASTDVTMDCSIQTDIQDFEFSLTCVNLTSVSENAPNTTLYITRLMFKADNEHHGKVCSCSFMKDNIKKTDTIVLDIISYPLIKVEENLSCNGTEDIKITCQGVGELTSFGFSDWMHSFNGTFIRKLQGDSKNEMSVLTIPQCTYRDVGDYLCSAFNTYQQKRFWSNKTTSVTYFGSPIVTSANTYNTSDTTFSVHYFSRPTPKEEKWYHFDELIHGSSRFILRSAKEPIHSEIYGKPISIEGYSANLTITNNESGIYTVVLQNDLGIAKHQFILKTAAGSKFPMNSVILVSAVGIVFIITAVVTVVSMDYSNRQHFFPRTEHSTQGGSIYYAAPPPESADNIHAYDSTRPIYEGIREYEHGRHYDLIEPYPDENIERKDDIEEEDSIHTYFEIE